MCGKILRTFEQNDSTITARMTINVKEEENESVGDL